MGKNEKEWIFQAESDLDAAKTLFAGRKYIHTVFMCHLAVEKALKAVFQKEHDKQPPRTHDLAYLAKASSFQSSFDLLGFIEGLSSLSVPARYPDDLKTMSKDYNKKKTAIILAKSEEVIKCVKQQLSEK